MVRKIQWESGVFDEIELIYEKAAQDEGIASLLSEVETMALEEAERRCGQITNEQFSSMSETGKEMLIYRLSHDGLQSFVPSMEEPRIEVTLSARFSQVAGCTMFSILNRLEKLDGSYNAVRFPKATLELRVPLGGRNGIFKFTMLVMQLYPWLSVKETSTGTIGNI